ncbi:hypothetical protein EJ110_NYTH59722 [Nymphaea thermarum]|nr:hypothetical protein EJ110_NYTH59722 [Nymphaea thermarum]
MDPFSLWVWSDKLGKCSNICAHKHALHVADGYAEMALARKAPMPSIIEHGGTGGEGGDRGVLTKNDFNSYFLTMTTTSSIAAKTAMSSISSQASHSAISCDHITSSSSILK